MRVVAPSEGAVREALALGPALLARAVVEGEPHVGAVITRGPAVILGAAQRAGRVVRLDACATSSTPVLRRATSGIAAHVASDAIIWALALPHVASLHPDASARTLLNRNVRGFLRGLTRAGVPAAYFGRANIAVRRAPTCLLGFDVTAEGAVLIEVIAGMGAGLALPASIATDDELEADRARGPLSGALNDATRLSAPDLAQTVMNAFDASPSQGLVTPMSSGPPLTDAEDPMPVGYRPGPRRRIPIGWLDTGVLDAGSASSIWVGGDALTSRHVYSAIARGETESVKGAAIDGATLEDLREAVRSARGSRSGDGGSSGRPVR